MKKILYIISDDSFGGGSQCVLDLVENIDRKKWLPILISKNYYIHERLNNKCQNYIVKMQGRFDQNAIAKIREIIKKEKPDIVHPHATRAGILGTMAAKNTNIPVIYTEHLYTKEYQPKNKFIFWLQLKTFKKISPNITKIIAVSNAVKDFLVVKKVFPMKKIEVIYNGVKISNLKSQISNLHFKSENIIIGSIGALEPIKGYKYLLEAIRIIKKENPEIYDKINLEIIGNGSEKGKLQELAKELKIENKIKFIDKIENIKEQMQNWDLYIQPSLSESFGLALAKAMSMRISCIATNVGGMPEILHEYTNITNNTNSDYGVLIPFRSSEAIKNAIMKLIENPNLRKKLGKKARERIVNHFSLEKMIKKTEELYEKIV